MLGIGGGYTNIDEGPFVLHNLWWFWSNITACCCHCVGVNLDTSTMHPYILRLPLLVNGGGMVFYVSGELRPGIEEACNSCVVLCEDLDDCWLTEDRWFGLITDSFNGGSTCINGDGNLLLFELLSLLLKHWLSRGVLCEDLYDCWPTREIWDGLMTELFNGGETYINGNDNLLLFEWQSLWLKHRLSRGVVRCLPWLFPVPLLWQLPIPLGHGMMNKILVFGEIVCLLFCLLMDIKRWEPNFWRDNCGHVWVYVPGIKIYYDLFVSISSELGSKIWPLRKRQFLKGTYILP